MRSLRRDRSAAAVPSTAQRLALQAASLLLAYPDAGLLDRLPELRAVADLQPEPGAAELHRFCDHLVAVPLEQLQADYTDIFDLRRRCCLYLTYFTHGDTRQRGMALLRFSHAYRSAGADFAGDELPDHLAVVCEFAASVDPVAGLRLLREHRAGLELVRAALIDVSSPYVDVIDLVRGVLGEATPRDIERALELARTGPPEEEVGLEPFGPPELMGGRSMGDPRTGGYR